MDIRREFHLPNGYYILLKKKKMICDVYFHQFKIKVVSFKLQRQIHILIQGKRYLDYSTKSSSKNKCSKLAIKALRKVSDLLQSSKKRFHYHARLGLFIVIFLFLSISQSMILLITNFYWLYGLTDFIFIDIIVTFCYCWVLLM